MDAPTVPSPSLYGLVLAGGRSSRMQRDKAALEYAGRSQLERAVDIITPLVGRVFVSVRPEQAADPLRARYAQIVDSGEVAGPIAGIIAAQARHPDVAWLVLACDLPLLDRRTLEHLLRSRRPARQATAYRSTRDGLPEPLCAIYEPSSREALRAHVASGRDCPRKFLLGADAELLDQPEPGALDNVNTPQEYGSATSRLPDATRAAVATRQINVQYYALLREQAGVAGYRRSYSSGALSGAPGTLSVLAGAGDAARRGELRVRRLESASERGRLRGLHPAGGRGLGPPPVS